MCDHESTKKNFLIKLKHYIFQSGLHEWHIIFYIGSSVYIASAIIFCIFGTGETQPWNNIEDEEKKDVDGIENIAFDGVDLQDNAVGKNEQSNKADL